MFPVASSITQEETPKEKPLNNKYRSIITTSSASNKSLTGDVEMDKINNMLDLEQQSNKLATWNKINKTMKIQKLHSFADTYSVEHGLNPKEIKALKQFLTNCLEQGKLLKTKEIVYDKTENRIVTIPSLFFNSTSKSFTLKNLDNKRINTLKNLTPTPPAKSTTTIPPSTP